MNPALRAALEQTLGASVSGARSLAGGDINDAFLVELADGRRLFVKTHRASPPGMFAAEAKGLRWLADANAIRIPEVIAAKEQSGAAPAFLILELLSPAKRVGDFDERLGRQLAALHITGAPSFGLDHDNYIGRLYQTNTPADTWAEFLWKRRLEPQCQAAYDQGLVDDGMLRSFERLSAVLADRVGENEPPSRLHGDLWGGNLHVDASGEPCLIDPAAYGGHREIDLAMMRLFGGFTERTFAAYAEAAPLSPGAEERVPLYQLYPLLVHVNLFGSSYVDGVRRALRAIL